MKYIIDNTRKKWYFLFSRKEKTAFA